MIIAQWPKASEAEGWGQGALDQFGIIQETIRSIRNARAENKVQAGRKIPALFVCGEKLDLLKANLREIVALAHLDAAQTTCVASIEIIPEDQVALVVSGITVYLKLSEGVDLEAEQERIKKELAGLESEIKRLENLLASPFGQKAPAQVVEKERQKLADYIESAAKLKSQVR